VKKIVFTGSASSIIG